MYAIRDTQHLQFWSQHIDWVGFSKQKSEFIKSTTAETQQRLSFWENYQPKFSYGKLLDGIG